MFFNVDHDQSSFVKLNAWSYMRLYRSVCVEYIIKYYNLDQLKLKDKLKNMLTLCFVSCLTKRENEHVSGTWT